MRLSGWIFMLVSWGLIIGLFVYCMIRTLCSQKRWQGEEENP